MNTQSQEILHELKEIKEELAYIKDNMADKDMFLSIEEKELLEQSYIHEKEGKLVSSKDLKKRLEL